MEAPPFANFSDAEMRRLLDDERLEVLDWRGKRVDAPGFVEALAADIAVTGNSLAITDGLLEKLSNLKLIVKLSTGLDMIDIPAVLRRGILLCNTPGANSVARSGSSAQTNTAFGAPSASANSAPRMTQTPSTSSPM